MKTEQQNQSIDNWAQKAVEIATQLTAKASRGNDKTVRYSSLAPIPEHKPLGNVKAIIR